MDKLLILRITKDILWGYPTWISILDKLPWFWISSSGVPELIRIIWTYPDLSGLIRLILCVQVPRWPGTLNPRNPKLYLGFLVPLNQPASGMDKKLFIIGTDAKVNRILVQMESACGVCWYALCTPCPAQHNQVLGSMNSSPQLSHAPSIVGTLAFLGRGDRFSQAQLSAAVLMQVQATGVQPGGQERYEWHCMLRSRLCLSSTKVWFSQLTMTICWRYSVKSLWSAAGVLDNNSQPYAPGRKWITAQLATQLATQHEYSCFHTKWKTLWSLFQCAKCQSDQYTIISVLSYHEYSLTVLVQANCNCDKAHTLVPLQGMMGWLPWVTLVQPVRKLPVCLINSCGSKIQWIVTLRFNNTTLLCRSLLQQT